MLLLLLPVMMITPGPGTASASVPSVTAISTAYTGVVTVMGRDMGPDPAC